MEVIVNVPSDASRLAVVGTAERHLKMIRESLRVNVAARDSVVRITGPEEAVLTAQRVLERLARLGHERPTTPECVMDLIAEEAHRTPPRPGREGSARAAADWDGRLDVYVSGRPVRPKTVNQARYLDAIRDHDLVVGVGPAGTGKTYVAVAAAVHLLKTDRVSRLILARPAVEAGEKLGYLPGGLEAKVNPFLRPLFDALHDMMDYPTIRRFMENDVIEVVPLAYMRGRTLNNAVVICDEAQNTTRGQMKMFLTRMGHGTKMIVTGDVTQIDLPDPRESGLVDAFRRLARVPGVATVVLDAGDVVRHPIVQRVIEAYGDDDADPARQRATMRRMLGGEGRDEGGEVG